MIPLPSGSSGLVDELALFVWPVVLGGRNPALPTDSRADLELIDEHRFGSDGANRTLTQFSLRTSRP